MPEGYLPILVMVVVAFGFAAIALGVSALLGPRRHNSAKNEPYESGILPFGDAKRRFPVQFYVVAVLFILFDVEVILMYPWAVAARKFGLVWAGRDGDLRRHSAGRLCLCVEERRVQVAIARRGLPLLAKVCGNGSRRKTAR